MNKSQTLNDSVLNYYNQIPSFTIYPPLPLPSHSTNISSHSTNISPHSTIIRGGKATLTDTAVKSVNIDEYESETAIISSSDEAVSKQQSVISLTFNQVESGCEYIKIDPKQVNVFNGARKLLKRDMQIPKEIRDECALLISNLYRPYEVEVGIPLPNKTYLRKIFDDKRTATRALKILLKGSEQQGPIIEVIQKANPNKGLCTEYRLTAKYRNRNLQSYTITNKKLLTKLAIMFDEEIQEVFDNSIMGYQVASYNYIELPTLEDIYEQADEMVNTKATNKDGKIYNYKRKLTEVQLNRDKYVFIEEQINIFKTLTSNGYITPSYSEAAGGRVADSFTLMPSWIRKLCTINGNPLIENDFTSLHPVIIAYHYMNRVSDAEANKMKSVLKEYNGDLHAFIAARMGIPRNKVKKSHLSIFNKRIEAMEKDSVWQCWATEFPEYAKVIIEDKQDYTMGMNMDGVIASGFEPHKNTSRMLFRLEVDLMTEITKELTESNIPGIYVYDAIYTTIDISNLMKKIATKLEYISLTV
jgi:hypothetical protein